MRCSHSFGTHLSKSGVAPRVAQAAMRHSNINLTMTTYTDARLLDTAEAVEGLPILDDRTVAPNVGKEGQIESSTDQTESDDSVSPK